MFIHFLSQTILPIWLLAAACQCPPSSNRWWCHSLPSGTIAGAEAQAGKQQPLALSVEVESAKPSSGQCQAESPSDKRKIVFTGL